MAVLFDLSSKRLNHGSPAALADIVPISICMWVKPSSISNDRHMLSKGDRVRLAVGDYTIPPDVFATSNVLSFRRSYSTTNAESYSVGSALTASAWNFVAVTFDGTNAPKLYHGDPDTLAHQLTYKFQQAPSGALVSDSSNTLQIGRRNATNENWLGDIGFYALWNTTLGLSRIRQIQYGCRPNRSTTLKIWCFPGWDDTTCYSWSAEGLEAVYQTVGTPPLPSWPDPPFAPPYGAMFGPHRWAQMLALTVDGSISASGSLSRAIARTTSGGLALTGTATKATSRPVAGSLAASGSIAKATARSVSGALAAAGSVARSTARSVAGSLGLTGSIAKSVARTVSGAMALVGALGGRTIARTIAGALAMTGAVTAVGGSVVIGQVKSFTAYVRNSSARAVYVMQALTQRAGAWVSQTRTSEKATVSNPHARNEEVRETGQHETET